MSGKRLGALAAAAVLLVAVPARTADKEAINEAIAKGVRNLKSFQQPGGSWPHAQIGLTSLIALTLLECGESADEQIIQKAAAAVRANAPQMEDTYSIALSILFLDKLGEPVDVALIESLAVRLMGGQTPRGEWSYKCPTAPEGEQRRLTALVKERAEEGRPKELSRVEPGQRTAKDLPREVQDQLDRVKKLRAAGAAARGGMMITGDNSNTQFAVLGLWVARRYGVPVDGSLRDTERYFRETQEIGGGWPYTAMTGQLALPIPGGGPGISTASPAMTCAGLLGIGLAYGAWNEAALRTDPKEGPGKPGAPPVKVGDPSKDKAVVSAFHLLGAWVDGMARFEGGRAPKIDYRNGKFYYFVWSLERVGVAYGVEKFGRTDWYDFASAVLLANQSADGGWDNGEFHHGPDTCFALLVLRRANLAQDLTRALKSQMKDGMQSALRQGGVGGADLVKGKKAFFEKPAGEDAAKVGDDDARAARLGKQLAAAEGDKLDRALKELCDSKGAAYTDALAGAIARLDGDARKKAREALAERLSRMTNATLGVKLEDDDPEVRRAAALAVAMKEDKTHAYKLIELLDDREPTVGHAAHAALKSLAGEDLGPAKDATREERAKAVLAWKAWWAKEQKK